VNGVSESSGVVSGHANRSGGIGHVKDAHPTVEVGDIGTVSGHSHVPSLSHDRLLACSDWVGGVLNVNDLQSGVRIGEVGIVTSEVDAACLRSGVEIRYPDWTEGLPTS